MPTYEDHLGGTWERPTDVNPGWRVSVYPIAIRDGRVLMAEPVWAQRWELPGGGVEPDLEETLLEAAIRECYEETGYTFVPEAGTLQLAMEGFFVIRSRHAFFHSLTFVVQGVAVGEQDPAWQPDPDEIVRVEWVDLETLTRDQCQGFQWDALVKLNLIPEQSGQS